MKVIKSVTCTGIVNHRDAYFKASLCTNENGAALVFAVTLRNPIDKVEDISRVRNILDGRIKKRFLKGLCNSKIGKLTECISFSSTTKHLCSREAMQAMLDQFKRVSERSLAEQLGLKWERKEGDLITELSANTPATTPAKYTNEDSEVEAR